MFQNKNSLSTLYPDIDYIKETSVNISLVLHNTFLIKADKGALLFGFI